MAIKKTGQRGFMFRYCEDYRNLPSKVLGYEKQLHGGFAVDNRERHGHIYYGMPGCGLLRISPDLATQELIELPTDLLKVNFHSTKIGMFDGKMRLFMPANDAAMVAVVSLEGDIDFILPKPEFKQYLEQES